MSENKQMKKSRPDSSGHKKLKKKKSVSSELRSEIEDLHDAIADLHEDIKRMAPPGAWKRASRSFTGGILRGLGFIFGTTIIAALFIWGAQKAVQSPKFQDWFSEKLTSVVSDSIDKAIPDIKLPSLK